ncbi:GPI transamidase component [Zygosaccharomyces mellis]|uniref:GPI transamidase component n=1 Tax=Zygosaccharomyces mellis TaxID=42258 RepID=A0A4C2E147_9SACH|nr:GPI transamidase component [Zygosaccharomyces mellis]
MPSTTFKLRKLIGVCLLALYLLLGVPVWYKLTTTYRAPLPIEYIHALHEDKLQDIHMVIPVYIKCDTYRFPDLHEAVQVQVNSLLNSKNQNVPWSLQLMPYDAKKLQDSNTSKGADYHVVNLVLDGFVGFSLAYDAKETTVFFDDSSVITNDLPFFIAQTVVEHAFELEWSELSSEKSLKATNSMAISYRPNIHVSISLLTGDGYPVSWEIDSTLKKYFSPLRKFLSPLVNFTVDTGILYYNDLNLHTLNTRKNVTWQDLSHSIDLSELLSMNYFSESASLNLAVVFPSEQNCKHGLSFINDNWDGFLVPQWGMIVVNKYPLKQNSSLTERYLTPIMYQFATNIFQLLGLKKDSQELISPSITIDSFKRITILQNIHKAEETLWSLAKLTQAFQTMSIPKEVLRNVTEALELRLQIVDMLNDPFQGDDELWNRALILSNQLVELSEAAFFHGEMVQQNFFPQEHKLAVYLPLLGPITVVTFFGFIRLIKEKPDDKKKRSNEPEKPTGNVVEKTYELEE